MGTAVLVTVGFSTVVGVGTGVSDGMGVEVNTGVCVGKGGVGVGSTGVGPQAANSVLSKRQSPNIVHVFFISKTLLPFGKGRANFG